MIHFYLFKMIFLQHVARDIIQVSLPLMCNGNQDNDFDKLCQVKFLLMVFLCFYFRGLIQVSFISDME